MRLPLSPSTNRGSFTLHTLCPLSYTRIHLFDQSLQTMGKKVQHQQEVERRERAATKLQAVNRGAKSRQLVKEKVGRVGTYGDTYMCQHSWAQRSTSSQKRRRDRARRNQARSQARNQAATKIQSVSRRRQAHKVAGTLSASVCLLSARNGVTTYTHAESAGA